MRIALTLLLFAGSAFGWGCEGHQMIALIARAHLTPAASAAVDQLLRENPADPTLRRFCRERPNDPMADAATWADDERSIDKSTEAWHFIDIPLAVRSGSVPEKDAMKWCAAKADGSPGCIVSAIDHEGAILRDPNQPAAARATALRYVIHFVGDVSQPLHVVDNHDRGGNCTSIKFFGENKPENLHTIWDSQLIAREMAAGQTTETRYAGELDESFSRHWPEWGEANPDILAWSWESHKLAETTAYGDLKPLIPIEPVTAGQADQEACNLERDNVAALHIAIGAAYAAEALPVIREQLAKAGYRLAGLLNQTFK